MINTERNRALLTDLSTALGREGRGEVFLDVSGARWSMGKVSDRRTEMFSAEVG